MTAVSGLIKKAIANELITEDVVVAQLNKAKENGVSILSQLIKEKMLNSLAVAELASKEFGLPYLDLNSFDMSMISSLDIKGGDEFNQLLPLMQRGEKLFIAVSDPSNMQVIEHIKFQTGLSPELIIVEDDKLSKHIENISSTKEFGDLSDLDEKLEDLDITTAELDIANAEASSDDAPIVRFVNKVLLDAINSGASDIHFEPYEKLYRVRLRQDGILHTYVTPPQNLAARLAARIKVMAQLDISERRVPQDGRFRMRLSKNKAIDFRVSTCPTLFGEKIVMRILDPTSAQIGVDRLGYEGFQKELFLKAIHSPQGMVLVTGPTGSGKTVSLYTALNILNVEEKNISTAEDPVEINLSGINQVNVKPKIGLTFSSALKSFLRQDPDIIMVGEVRDLETAEIAVKAAQTGHLVLSTLHTNSAADTLTRMISMGVPAFNLATSVILVIAQRLARRLCDECKEEIEMPINAKLEMGFTEEEAKTLVLYKPVGCDNCKEGYKGRIGIYEVMPITPALIDIMLKGGNAVDIKKQAEAEGFWNIRKAALHKLKKGLTTFDEIYRVSKE